MNFKDKLTNLIKEVPKHYDYDGLRSLLKKALNEQEAIEKKNNRKAISKAAQAEQEKVLNLKKKQDNQRRFGLISAKEAIEIIDQMIAYEQNKIQKPENKTKPETKIQNLNEFKKND